MNEAEAKRFAAGPAANTNVSGSQQLRRFCAGSRFGREGGYVTRLAERQVATAGGGGVTLPFAIRRNSAYDLLPSKDREFDPCS